MSFLDDYTRLKNNQGVSTRWAKLFNVPQDGSYGEITTLKLGLVNIYHQENGGDVHCHEIPKEFMLYLEHAIESEFKNLLQKALNFQAVDVENTAKWAVEEHYKLLIEAGLAT